MAHTYLDKPDTPDPPPHDGSAVLLAQGPDAADPPAPTSGVDDLAQIIRAYNQVTDKLQHSHEVLQSEVMRLRQELASADAQLQRSKRLSALGEMAAGIAHEVRNPLAAIQLYTSMIVQDLQAGTDADDTLQTTRKIADAVRGLDQIVGDVLSFAREIKPKRSVLAVSRIFDRAVQAHWPAIQAADVQVIRLDQQQSPALTIYADVDLIHRALLNLVRNAVDAMAEVDGPRELTLDAVRDEAGSILRIADTGPGVDADTVDRLFNPFFTTRATGTGLGLAIVHRIIDAHGGAISVGGRLDGQAGAVFELSLPGIPPSAIGDLRSGSDDWLEDRLQVTDCRSESA